MLEFSFLLRDFYICNINKYINRIKTFANFLNFIISIKQVPIFFLFAMLNTRA